MSAPGHGEVGFVVLSHTEPELVERLVLTLTSEAAGAPVLVCHDGRRTALDPSRLSAAAGVDLLVHDGARWGSWELTARALRAAGDVIRADPAVEWVVLLSGQSYPLHPLRSFVATLLESPADAHLGLLPGEQQSAARWTQWRFDGADRARYRTVTLPWHPLWETHAVRLPVSVATRHQPFGGVRFHRDPADGGRVSAMLAYLPLRPPVRRFRPVKASQWWCLRRQAVLQAQRLLEPSDRWARHFSKTFTSDELAVPTLLATMGASVSDVPLHAMWWPSGPSPDLLTEDRWDWLAGRSEPFCRKVSLHDSPQLLDDLDALRAERADGTTS